MTPEEEAHWRYQLELMTNWNINYDRVGSWRECPPEVSWLREEARYYGHLSTAHLRRQAAERGEWVL